jgi:hypothetical protein
MITFSRLTEISPDTIARHMSDPRMAEHMPLRTGGFGGEEAKAVVAAKEGLWAKDGLGHWAFLKDGAYGGWGGFQKEGDDWDFGLVLRPDAFGLGMAITRQALAFARANGLGEVTFLLPPSRRHLGALRRMGAEYVGQITHAGHAFGQYRLDLEGAGRTRP